MEIKRVAVIGAGVMGSGIAAQVANAGVPVLLLDIVPPEGPRNALAQGAIERMLKADPAPFMTKKAAALVTPGNLEDDLAALADVDWIIEAVVEKPEVKRALFSKLDGVRKAGSVVSSNTSTIPLARLVDGQSETFAQDFLITHFFNPPRYMRLLEIVSGPTTRLEALAAVQAFGDVRLGKGVVLCKDSPGFIANRIGMYWIQMALNEALQRGLSVEEVDAVMGRPLGFPKTGIFGLMDLVGLDLMPYLAGSLKANLPPEDPFCQAYVLPPVVAEMIANGYTGRKGKGGFYRVNKSAGGKIKEAVNLQTGAYAPVQSPTLASAEAGKKGGIRGVLTHPDKGGQYARAVMLRTLAYAASLVPDVADSVADVDTAMTLGFNWGSGPFAMMDALGTDILIAELEKEGIAVPPLLAQAKGRRFYRVEGKAFQHLTPAGTYAPVVRPEGVLLLADIKRVSQPVAKNASASLWDIGDGVLCLEFHSKMNAIDLDIFALERKAISLIGDGKGVWKALVVHNEADNFSVGANLGMAMFLINTALWSQVEQFVQEGQETYKALKFAPFPVVAAPSGLALGGGCEILLHADHVQAHAETYCGLVEVGVGLIPGWGGCKEMLLRCFERPKGGGPLPPVAAAFETIGTAKTAKSAFEAKEIGYFRKSDGLTMNRDRLLYDAKMKALELAKNYHPPEPKTLRLAGPTIKAALSLAVEGLVQQGKATPHDVVVSGHLADVLSGYDSDITAERTEDDMLLYERKAFVQLVRTPGTIARIEYMLANGKPLRN